MTFGPTRLPQDFSAITILYGFPFVVRVNNSVFMLPTNFFQSVFDFFFQSVFDLSLDLLPEKNTCQLLQDICTGPPH